MLNMRVQTKVTFFGTEAAIPELGGETASFLINDEVMVDTGWNIVENLRRHGIDPGSIRYLLLTHMHHDHYISLPSLLYYFLITNKDLSGLKILGPEEDLQPIMDHTLEFLFLGRKFYPNRSYPTIIPLKPGDRYDDEHFHLETTSSLHPVQALCYKYTDKKTEKSVTFTGDTAYHPPIVDLARGSSLLIHEATYGASPANPLKNGGLHSSAMDAAEVAKAAEVGQLALIHGLRRNIESSIQAAQSIYSGPVMWPAKDQTILL
ncbi:ribonuclease Z [Paenibacillus sp. FSL H7-0331]|uniref:MBL fold metallo-hydrolase n=2 Tax=Paenibacillus sp. FSL H7-0331 TaxID=1920421 RepID=UPI0030F75CE8